MSLSKHRLIIFLVALIAYIFLLYSAKKLNVFGNPHNVINSDITSYYTYLPAVFIYHDMSLEFIKDLPGTWPYSIWRHQTPKGKSVLKMTYGVSFLYLPFFLIAHFLALLFTETSNGYTSIYAASIIFASAFYTCFGLVLSYKLLLRYFKTFTAIFVTALLLLATNLFFYSTFQGPYSHSFSFFLFSLFLYITVKYYDKPTVKKIILLGLTFGLITLIRPTNGLISLFFVFFNVFNVSSFIFRVRFFLNNYLHIITLTFCTSLVWLPQLIYWKYTSGEFFYYSYRDEVFFFDNPHIKEGLFGYRKGWFVYTPIMLFSLLGTLLLIFKKSFAKLFLLPLILFIPLNIYVVLSWWCWWYGGGLGLRAFIDSYALLVIPLAFFIEYLSQPGKVKMFLVYLFFSLFIVLNFFQSWQYEKGIIHWGFMTKKAFWAAFGKTEIPVDFDCLLKVPDYDLAKETGKDVSYFIGCGEEKLYYYSQLSSDSLQKQPIVIEPHQYAAIYFAQPVFKTQMSLYLDQNDTYELVFLKNKSIIDRNTFKAIKEKSGIYNYKFNDKLKVEGFNKIKIYPIEREGVCSFGNIQFK